MNRLCQAVPLLTGVLLPHQDSFVLYDRAEFYCTLLQFINTLHDYSANCYLKNPQKEMVREDSVNLNH